MTAVSGATGRNELMERAVYRRADKRLSIILQGAPVAEQSPDGTVRLVTGLPYVPVINGFLAPGPVESELAMTENLNTVPVPKLHEYRGFRQHDGTLYKPKDKRSRRDRRAGRKGYKRAKQHYGKTYVLTRGQVMWGIVLLCGVMIMGSALLCQFYIHVLNGLQAVK